MPPPSRSKPPWLVEAASRRQKWIDQAQSLNIYIAGASGKKLDDTYKLAWLRGLKTTYYLRTKAATHVEMSTVTKSRHNAVSSRRLRRRRSMRSLRKRARNSMRAACATDVKFCGVDDPTARHANDLQPHATRGVSVIARMHMRFHDA